MSYIVSWSGGKDSCFACYEVLCRGYKVSYLLNFISKDHRRVGSHGTEAKLIELQAKALGLLLIQRETTWNGYENELKAAVRSLIPSGIKGMVFGDIYLQGHRDWVERVCGELGIEAVEPLWGRDLEGLLLGFISAGFEAIIVSADSDLFGEEWIGRKVDAEFLSYLKANNIDVCGENGEYHTFVTNGPIFKWKIKIGECRPALRDNRWYLDILDYSLDNKSPGGEK